MPNLTYSSSFLSFPLTFHTQHILCFRSSIPSTPPEEWQTHIKEAISFFQKAVSWSKEG